MLPAHIVSALPLSFLLAIKMAAAQPSPEMILHNMDTNRDGRISRQEWRGPPPRFDVLDSNRDGFITREELESASRRRQTTFAARISPVDVHVHLHGDPSGTVGERLIIDYAAAADEAIAQMDKNNVRMSVIMIPPAVHFGRFRYQSLLAEAKRRPDRFAVLAGGGTLNPVIHATAPGNVTEEIRRSFEEEAERALRAGAIGFGEMSALHLSYFKQHPFEEAAPDHPLFLLLSDIAARSDVPIDLHIDLVVEDMPTPAKLREASANNPPRLKANLDGFDRLLAHNPKTRIILSHSVDGTGGRKAAVIRRLLERHPNLSMSLNVLPGYLFLENLPLKGTGGIAPDWMQLIKDFPDRFLIGSDQFYSPPCPTCKSRNVLTPSLRWLKLLPDEIAKKVAVENPRRIFKLK